MLRRLARRLLAPAIRFAWRDSPPVMEVGRGTDGVYLHFAAPGGPCVWTRISPDDARELGAAFYAAARDAQEGVPLPGDDEQQDDASDLRW